MSSSGANDLIQKVLKDVKEMSSLNQIVVGGAAGLTTGYILSKVGKIAAFTVGTSVILLQVAQNSGYIEIKWGKKSKIDQLKKKAIAAAEEVGLTKTDQKTKVEKALTEAKVNFFFLIINFIYLKNKKKHFFLQRFF
jgi:FUN14 domain-containing protein 1